METLTGTDIDKAQALLEQGCLVAIPTETVYGLAANALDPEAVLKIFEAKQRPQFNPLIVHISDWADAEHYVSHIPATAQLLAKAFTPGPLTFLLPKKDIIPDIITSGSSLVALRVPAHPVCRALLGRLSFPLAAPSANEFGYISPTLAAHVQQSLDGKVAYILDGGAATVGLESTIIGFDESEEVIVYRVGGLGIEQLEAFLGKKVRFPVRTQEQAPLTSGQLKSHYAPHTALYTGDISDLASQFPGKKIASISFSNTYPLEHVQQFVLSPAGSLTEAAGNLFRVMREIDALQADIILAEIFPDEGLGRAINDRLNRARAVFKP
ncbi:MAG TPA: L-threonylcarbamoyladenylate synthase [Chitinophagaceae bacterium]|nr:L-threonylcarbamoyladenylate synthase [Chitinophagaceae bacterium]